MRTLAAGLVLLAAATSASCTAFQRWQMRRTQENRAIQLQDVAKGWCQTIRASQVIPVYPLTEDVQPGDVFLVTKTIQQQADDYKGDGFLALDYHIGRLNPRQYGSFYQHSFLVPPPPEGGQGGKLLPAQWMRPAGFEVSAGKAWDAAPRAAFPSYSFSVQDGAGFNLALPVQGVPVGLSLLGASAANGSITIGDGRTFGVDVLSLHDDLREWCALRASSLAPHGASGNAYLRVVSRVYLTGSLDVALSRTASGGAGLDAGAAAPVELLRVEPPEPGQERQSAAKDYSDALETINRAVDKSLAGSAPAGSLRVVSASSGTVTMREVLHPPLVFGYLGFDCQILPTGLPGPPIPTTLTLNDPEAARQLFASTRKAELASQRLFASAVELAAELMRADGLSQDARNSGRGLLERADGLASYVRGEAPIYEEALADDPDLVPVRRWSFEDVPGNASLRGYRRFVKFTRSVEDSRKVLAAALASPRAGLIEGDAVVVLDEAARRRLEWDLQALEAMCAQRPWERDQHEVQAAIFVWLVPLLER